MTANLGPFQPAFPTSVIVPASHSALKGLHVRTLLDDLDRMLLHILLRNLLFQTFLEVPLFFTLSFGRCLA